MAMYGRFTGRAQKAILLAQEEAQRLKHNYVGTEHLLLGLISEGEGIAAKTLEAEGVNIEVARSQVVNAVGYGNYETEILGFTPRTKKVFELSFLEARKLGHNYIGTEHILLGLIEEGEGVAIAILRSFGMDIDKLKATIIEMLAEGNSKQSEMGEETNTPNLNKYSTNLKELAKD